MNLWIKYYWLKLAILSNQRWRIIGGQLPNQWLVHLFAWPTGEKYQHHKVKLEDWNGLFEINLKVSNLAWALLKQYGEELCFGTTDLLEFEHVYTLQYLKLTDEWILVLFFSGKRKAFPKKGRWLVELWEKLYFPTQHYEFMTYHLTPSWLQNQLWC